MLCIVLVAVLSHRIVSLSSIIRMLDVISLCLVPQGNPERGENPEGSHKGILCVCVFGCVCV